MNLKQLFGDDRAVSPVIGVILMVAITVILAAVIGTFVLGLGDQVQSTTPTASFETDYTQNSGGNDTLEITHGGGDTIAANSLNATVTGAVTKNTSLSATINGDVFTGGDITAGSTETLDGARFTSVSDTNSEYLDLSGATVRVVYSGESGDNSAVLAKWSGPDA